MPFKLKFTKLPPDDFADWLAADHMVSLSHIKHVGAGEIALLNSINIYTMEEFSAWYMSFWTTSVNGERVVRDVNSHNETVYNELTELGIKVNTTEIVKQIAGWVRMSDGH